MSNAHIVCWTFKFVLLPAGVAASWSSSLIYASRLTSGLHHYKCLFCKFYGNSMAIRTADEVAHMNYGRTACGAGPAVSF